MAVYQLNSSLWFPDPRQGESDGLVAIGGDLSVKRLLYAYSNGYFPWFSFQRRMTPMWYCPLERFVIFPDEIHISHSMKQLLRKNRYEITMNQDFEGVINSCSTVNGRIHEDGAWLGPNMIKAYTELHKQGYASSVEVWEKISENEKRLIGGLYGVYIRNAFFGESMFSLVPNASKLALIYLADYLKKSGGHFIDCQFETSLFRSMGGRYIAYDEYMKLLNGHSIVYQSDLQECKTWWVFKDKKFKTESHKSDKTIFHPENHYSAEDCLKRAILHVKEHTGHSEINSLEEALHVLLRVFTSDDEKNIEVQQCPKCQNFLASGLWKNSIGIRDNEKVYELYLEAAKAGMAKAQCNLGIVIIKGIFDKPDYDAALYWFEQAVKQNYQMAEKYLLKYESLARKVLMDQVHGDHIEAVSHRDPKEIVTALVNNHQNVNITEKFVYLDNPYPEYRKVLTFDSGKDKIEMRVLMVAKNDSIEILSLYPVINDGAVFEVKIDTIYEWENGVEGTIFGYIGEKPISFFMTDYFLYKNDIEQGQTYQFKINALAYSCEILKEHTFQFVGQKAVDFLKNLGEESQLKDDGDVKPITFSLDSLVAFLQINDKYPDDLEYQSPIESYENVESNESEFIKFEITAFRNPDIKLPLFVKKDLVEFNPQQGVPIRGKGWVQGCLISHI